MIRIAAVLLALEVPGAVCGAMFLLAQAGGDAYRRGREWLREGHFDEAVQALEQAEQAMPDNARLQNLLGVALSRLGRVSEANTHYRKAIKLDRGLADAYKNLGFNLWSASEQAEAEQAFRSALKLTPEDEFTHYALGSICLSGGRDSDAIPHLEKALSLVERDWPVLLNLARAYFRRGLTAKALATTARIEARTDLTAAEEHGVAELLIHARQFAEAVKFLQTVARRRPEDGAAAGLLAAAYEGLGDLPRALESYERGVRLDPGNQDRYLDYTRLLLDLDRYDESIQVVQEGLRRAQDAYALYLRLGATELIKGNPDRAESWFRQAIAAHPEIPLGYVALGKAFMKSGNGSGAEEVLREARKKLPPDFVLEYFYGLALRDLGRNAEAAQAFGRATELNANVPEPHFELGKLLLAGGQLEKAKAELEWAIHMNERHAGAYFQLSRVYAKLGDLQNSKRFAAHAAELWRERGLDERRQNVSQPNP